MNARDQNQEKATFGGAQAAAALSDCLSIPGSLTHSRSTDDRHSALGFGGGCSTHRPTGLDPEMQLMEANAGIICRLKQI